MKQHTTSHQTVHFVGAGQAHASFFGPEPFFEDFGNEPLPSVQVKTCIVEGQRYVLVSFHDEKEILFEELMLLIKKQFRLKNDCSNIANNDNSVDTTFRHSVEVGLGLAAIPQEQKDDFLKRVDSLIDKNLGEESFNGHRLAKLLCCCEMQLYRKLKKLANLSTANYIRRYRLAKSLELLREGVFSVTDVCYHVGFHSLEYFSRSFKQMYGICPNDYRTGKMLK
ncbi:MAG: helix-turn-helix transcriptional regulator [Saprospiraceae bacterium]|nr:helix-turn-helix transcriptional regulator [Saprospiraceae bacterium]